MNNLHNWLVLLLLFSLVVLSPTPLQNTFSLRKYWIVWNVGQGQWSTLVNAEECHHFDMGGEKNPLQRVARLCRHKKNFVFLSHWDWDHVSFALKARRLLPQSCLALPPVGTSSARKMKILKAYSLCNASFQPANPPQRLTSTAAANPNTRAKIKSNDLSHVLLVEKKFLLPGDSSLSQEKVWSAKHSLNQVHFLLLGHHGSRTSNSDFLLSRLPKLKTAVASARFARYGHPHAEIHRRLKHYHVPLLKTEDWGNLWFEAAERPRRDAASGPKIAN